MKTIVSNLSKATTMVIVVMLVVLTASSVFIACNQDEKVEVKAENNIQQQNAFNVVKKVRTISNGIEIMTLSALYHLDENSKNYDRYMNMIIKAEKEDVPLKIFLKRDTILKTEWLSKNEQEQFEKKEVANRVIDDVLFSSKNNSLKEREIFRIKTSYRKSSLKNSMTMKRAKKFFKMFEKLNCKNNANISHCIPFQYAADGCQARAHYMRKLMADAGYDCKKICAYTGYTSNNQLFSTNTRANCCALWTYHIAPLVYIHDDYSSQQPVVIDPSLFYKPVSIETWLSKLEQDCMNGGVPSYYYDIVPSRCFDYNRVGEYYSYDDYLTTYSYLYNYAYESGCGDDF